MTWWLSPGCLGPQIGGCDPCPPAPCWSWDPRWVDRPLPPYSGIPIPPPPVFVPQPGQVVGVGKGDCCGSCSKGGACESACEAKKAVHGHVGALYVSDAELDALGSQVALMGADVDAVAHKERADLASTIAGGAAMKACFAAGLKWDDAGKKCVQEDDPTGASYVEALKKQGAKVELTIFQNERWTPYQVKWNAYRAQTIHEPSVYDALRTEFSTLVDEWKGKGQTTRAAVPPPLSDTSGANAIPWTWIIVGGVLVAIPFLLPSIAGIYLALMRGRSMGLV